MLKILGPPPSPHNIDCPSPNLMNVVLFTKSRLLFTFHSKQRRIMGCHDVKKISKDQRVGPTANSDQASDRWILTSSMVLSNPQLQVVQNSQNYQIQPTWLFFAPLDYIIIRLRCWIFIFEVFPAFIPRTTLSWCPVFMSYSQTNSPLWSYLICMFTYREGERERER